jgi:hypothetical protein
MPRIAAAVPLAVFSPRPRWGRTMRVRRPFPKPAADSPVTAAFYYRVKWGFQNEFERLFLKNQYPC